MKLREEEAARGSTVPPSAGPEGGGDPTLQSATRKLLERQELYNGFGNGLALAFELALTPAIFGLIGYGLDRWFGTLPVFTIILVLACVVGLGARQFYGYDAQMKEHEAAGPWARKPVSGSAATATTPAVPPTAPADARPTPPEGPEGR